MSKMQNINPITVSDCFTLFTLNISNNREGESTRSTCYPDRLHDFSVTIPRCYKDVYVNSFFSCTARLYNYLPAECFPLTYDLNGFKSRVNSTIFIQTFSKQNFTRPICPFFFFFLNLYTSLVLFNYVWSETQLKKEAVTL